MASTPAFRPPFKTALTDAKGFVTRAWEPIIQSIFSRLGGQVDKVEAAYQIAQAAAPATAEVVAGAGLSGGGEVGSNTALSLYVAQAAVASLPTASQEGDWAYAIDGRKVGEGSGSGTGVPCWWSNGAWIAVDSGTPVQT